MPPAAAAVVSSIFAVVELSPGTAAARRRSATPSAPTASTRSRCSSFSQQIYPMVNEDAQYGDELRAVCPPDAEETAWVHLDHGTPGELDSQCYVQERARREGAGYSTRITGH